MKPSKASLLLHPVFIACLFVLLANDFYWKQEYHNWLTGKLSDFAGVIVLPVFCFVLLPRLSKTFVLLACAIFFIWWKSPFSQPVIGILNELHCPVRRSVDYSDCLAVLVLPFVLRLEPMNFRLSRAFVFCLQWTLGTIAFFGLCATTMPYRSLFMAYPNNPEIYFHEAFKQKRDTTAVLETLQSKGIDYHLDSVMYYPVLNQESLYYKKPPGADSVVSWRRISQSPDSTLYIKRQGIPYYVIPVYETTSGTKHLMFRNVRFQLAENKRKTTITIETFESPGISGYTYMDKQARKMYKAIFENLFTQ